MGACDILRAGVAASATETAPATPQHERPQTITSLSYDCFGCCVSGFVTSMFERRYQRTVLFCAEAVIVHRFKLTLYLRCCLLPSYHCSLVECVAMPRLEIMLMCAGYVYRCGCLTGA
jgi:hypothetical protein